MIDKGFNKGIVKKFDTTKPNAGLMDGLTQLFNEYLTKFNVPFYNECCPDLTGNIFPVQYNAETEVFERYNGTEWVEIGSSGGDNLYTANGTFEDERTVYLGDNNFYILNNEDDSELRLSIDEEDKKIVLATSNADIDGASSALELSADSGDINFSLVAKEDDKSSGTGIYGDANAETVIINANRGLIVPTLSEYADNAAALLDGLALGTLYYTDVAGDGIVKVVI